MCVEGGLGRDWGALFGVCLEIGWFCWSDREKGVRGGVEKGYRDMCAYFNIKLYSNTEMNNV